MSRRQTDDFRKASAKTIPSGRRRFPADERRAQMMEQAADHFARHGFASSTRELAASLGITQALIYKHFASKDALIEQTLEAALGQPGGEPFGFDVDRPLAEGLGEFYRAFVAGATETRMRLFIRAGLDGRSWPTKRGAALTHNLFLPIIAGLRRAAGLPDIAERPAMRGERELVMMLHAAMVFLGIRRHVYGMPMPDNLDDVVNLYTTSFVSGAVPAIRALHESGEESLTVILLAPAPEQSGPKPISPGRKRSSST